LQPIKALKPTVAHSACNENHCKNKEDIFKTFERITHWLKGTLFKNEPETLDANLFDEG
jgi:hypothetical protein